MYETERCSREDCGAPADRIIDGRAFCARHRTVREDAPVPCKVAGCGAPTLPANFGLCAGHSSDRPWPPGTRLRTAAAAVFGALALLAAAVAPARAGGITAATIGTSSTTVLPANTGIGYRLFVIDNESAITTDLVACTFTGAAGLNAAGSFTIPPAVGGNLNRLVIQAPPNVTIREPLNCVATDAATPLTVFSE